MRSTLSSETCQVVHLHNEPIEPGSVLSEPEHESVEKVVRFVVGTGANTVRAIGPVLHPEAVAGLGVDIPLLRARVVRYGVPCP